MIYESTDDQREKAGSHEAKRIAALTPGTKVKVWLGSGTGFTAMKVLGTTVQSYDEYSGYRVFHLVDAYKSVYHTTADFIEKIK